MKKLILSLLAATTIAGAAQAYPTVIVANHAAAEVGVALTMEMSVGKILSLWLWSNHNHPQCSYYLCWSTLCRIWYEQIWSVCRR